VEGRVVAGMGVSCQVLSGETEENIKQQDSLSPRRDSNCAPPEYKTEGLSLEENFLRLRDKISLFLSLLAVP
jgi:hypothetical protein